MPHKPTGQPFKLTYPQSNPQVRWFSGPFLLQSWDNGREAYRAKRRVRLPPFFHGRRAFIRADLSFSAIFRLLRLLPFGGQSRPTGRV